jgi:hypothetical protein
MEPSLAVQLTLAVVLQAFLYALFGRFVTPRWKLLPQTAFYFAITWILAASLGWWSLVWTIGHPALGVFAHAFWCGKNGIDWRTCEPRDEYLRRSPLGVGSSFLNAK